MSVGGFVHTTRTPNTTPTTEPTRPKREVVVSVTRLAVLRLELSVCLFFLVFCGGCRGTSFFIWTETTVGRSTSL